MIIIDKQTRGRHGNKVFHFNTLKQMENILNQPSKTAYWDRYENFEQTSDILRDQIKTKEIPHSDLIYKSKEDLKAEYGTGNWRLHTLSLCGPFFRITEKDPRDFIKIKSPASFIHQSKAVVGIHIRGGDTRGADGMNGREIHPAEYYIKAIDFVLKEYDGDVTFALCTDDPDINYPSFYETYRYLKDKNIKFYFNPENHYMSDFSILAECDILIAGSSTFVTAAGMIGKHKKIIHSKDFVEQFKHEDQKWYSSFGNGMFFHDMNHVKSDYYDVWKLI
jgi:hypothetical protein|tara:strand:- start:18877 stop:19710 length:834 start_codon:yes stop_codon:yes gene_type:complete